MPERREQRESSPESAGRFNSTHWSVVLAAGQTETKARAQALEHLCRTYWYPLYVYVCRRGYSPHDAQDLTQDFFARLIEKRLVTLADRQRGRFRTFLLTALKHFLVNEWEKARTVQRGGRCTFLPLELESFGVPPADDHSPEKAYEKQWAATLLESVLRRLRDEASTGHRRELFERLKDYHWGPGTGVTYASIAFDLNITETSVKVAAHRLRQRFREVLRAEIAHTVAHEAEIDEELRHLFAVVSA